MAAAATNKKKAAPKSAKTAPKATKARKPAAPRGRWDKRWLGREIAVTLMDDSTLIGILREADDWAICLEITAEPGGEAVIPRDSIVVLEYSPTGYQDLFDEAGEELAEG